MTPGQEALAEAARVEAARVYSRTVPERVPVESSLPPEVTVGEWDAIVLQRRQSAAELAAAAPPANVVDLRSRRATG